MGYINKIVKICTR